MHGRALALVAALVTVAACSSDGERLAGVEPPSTGALVDESAGNSDPTTTAASVAPDATDPTSTTLAEPTEDPGSDPKRPFDEDPRTRVDAALLDDGDLGGAWEFQQRRPFGPGYDIGPNQTDCDPYWEFERLAELDGGVAGWWQAGAELRHEVYATGEDVDGLGARLIALVASGCPIVNWLEGGTFTVERVPIDVAGAEAMQFRSDGGEITMIALLSSGDLFSMIRVHRWPGGGGLVAFTADDLAGVMRIAAARLAAAGTAPPPTTLPLPTTLPTTTTLAPTTTLPTTTTTLPTTTTTIDPAAAEQRGLLLTADDLGPDWSSNGPDPYAIGSQEDENCPALVAVNDISDLLAWEIDLSRDDGVVVYQALGTASDASSASAMVEAFASIDECELPDDAFGPAAPVSGPIDLAGADAASRLEWRVAEGSIELTLWLATVAVGDHVTILGVTTDDTVEADVADVFDLAADRAVGRLLAG